MRRLIYAIFLTALLMPSLSASAQATTCPPSLIQTANDLITQARTVLNAGDRATADALLRAAQELLAPCYAIDATPTAIPTIPPTPTLIPTMTPTTSIPTAVPARNAVNTVIAQLGQFSEDVRGVDFSPNGLYALASSFDGNLYMYDTATYEQVRVFEGHTDWVFDADFNDDGSLLASASADNTVRIWDVASASTVQVLRDHTDNVTNVAFSPDGRRLVTTGQDNFARVYNTTTWQLLDSLRHDDWVWDVSFRPDSRRFATAGTDGSVIIWDSQSLRIVSRLTRHQSVVIAVAWSPDGAYILSGSHDGTAILWDANTFEPLRIFRGIDGRAIMDVSFTGDMSLVAVASFAGYVHIWELNGTPVGTYAGHDSPGVWAVQFSPDGQTFLSGADDGKMLLNSVR